MGDAIEIYRNLCAGEMKVWFIKGVSVFAKGLSDKDALDISRRGEVRSEIVGISGSRKDFSDSRRDVCERWVYH